MYAIRSYYENTLTIGSGETYDWLVDFGQQSFSSFYPNGTGGLQGTLPGGLAAPEIPTSSR